MCILQNKINQLKNQYGNQLLYIGLRGSRVYNINTIDSDYDLLVVIKNIQSYDDKSKDFDIMFLNENDFSNKMLRARLETIEAISNTIYDNHFKQNWINHINQNQNLYQNLMSYEFYSCIKNQIKQFDKTHQFKFLYHALIWYEISNQNNIIHLFENFNNDLTHKIKQHRESNLNQKYLIQQYQLIRQERLYSDIKKQKYSLIKSYLESI